MVRIAYNQGPDLAYWWLDRYVDFDAAQKPRVRESLEDWFAWHRQTQLDAYAAAFARARREIAEPASAAQVCRWFDELRADIRTGFRQALPALAGHARQLTPAQLLHLEQRFEHNNDETRDRYLQADPAARQRANVERIVERLEMVYGDLNGMQRAALSRSLAASPFNAERWLAERIERQHETLATLRWIQAERPAAELAEQALWKLLEHTEHSPREEYRAYQQRLVDFNCELVAQVHNQTTARQREWAAGRLAGWEADMRALMAP